MASLPVAMDTDGKRDDTTVITRTEDEDPEVRLRRRERREALKQAAQGEEDELLLDETDTEEVQEDLPAAGGPSATSSGYNDPLKGVHQQSDLTQLRKVASCVVRSEKPEPAKKQSCVMVFPVHETRM